MEALVDFTRLDGKWLDLEFLLDIMTHDPDPGVRHALVRMLCNNPPFQRSLNTPSRHRLDKEDLVHKLWLTFKYVMIFFFTFDEVQIVIKLGFVYDVVVQWHMIQKCVAV